MKNKFAFFFLEGKDFAAFRNYFPNSFAELGVLNLKTSLSSGPLKITIRGSRRQALPRVEIKCFLFVTFASVALFAEHLTVVSFGFSAF